MYKVTHFWRNNCIICIQNVYIIYVCNFVLCTKVKALPNRLFLCNFAMSLTLYVLFRIYARSRLAGMRAKEWTKNENRPEDKLRGFNPRIRKQNFFSHLINMFHVHVFVLKPEVSLRHRPIDHRDTIFGYTIIKCG